MRTVIVSIQDDYSIHECKALAESGGYEVVAVLHQNMDKINPLTYIGKGKLEELIQFTEASQIEKVIFDASLTPLQISHLDSVLSADVIDKIQLILELFAQRASTKEAKLQVELSALKYELPRIKGSYDHLSRLGGGIGTRGPGESKLAQKRDYFKEMISRLEDEIEKVKKNRDTQRKERQRSGLPILSLAGYTNAGKTTLFNLLTEETAYADDRLFATLDPLVRNTEINGQPFLMIDTVGFIRQIPTQLIASFRATIEEINNSALILHVLDISDPNYEDQFHSVNQVLKKVLTSPVPVLYVYNKADLLSEEQRKELELILPKGIFLSAKAKENIDVLKDRILEAYEASLVSFSFVIPYPKGNLLSLLITNSILTRLDYLEKGTLVEGKTTMELYEQVLARLK